MRKLGLIAATAAASIGVTSFAQAIEVNQGLAVKTVGKKGTKKKPRALKLSVTTTTNAVDMSKDGTYSTTKAVIHFDKNLKFGNKSFPTCSFQTVGSNPKKCPKGSLVGKGAANATVGEGQIKVTPKIEAYNDSKNRINLKLVTQPGQVDSSGILVGTLKRDLNKDYGFKLDVPIPAKLQEQLGLKITLTKFSTTISNKPYKKRKNGKTRKYYYVQSIGCPKGGRYKFGGDFTYSDDTSQNAKDTSKC